MLRRADAGTPRSAEGRKYGEVGAAERPLVASFIIANNVRVAIGCLAGGMFAGVGSLVVLGFNGLMLGTFAGHFANQGLLWYLLEFVVGHGVLELTAIWIAAAAGLLLGLAIVAPGDLSRSDALVLRGRVAVRMIGMTVVLLAIAGLIEGFLSVSGGGAAPRVLAAGWGASAFWRSTCSAAPASGPAYPAARIRSPAACPHPDGQPLDLFQARRSLSVVLARVEQQQLRLRQQRRQRVRDVVPQLAETLGVGHESVDSSDRYRSRRW